ncbi:MAG: septum formation protein Maf [Betaproteobacteria bacterium]|nr:septum formation protein Maf [Betaproteobacteria bacterium]
MERRPTVPTLILASSSSYRRMLLERLAVPFACISPHIDESPLTGESAPQTALRLARQKAEAIAKTRPEAFVIGSDQVATCRGHRLGKPESKEQALVQLQLQRGGETEFFTAVCFIAPGQPPQSEIVSTRVIWRPEDELSDALLERYIELERPLDCAGAAKSEGLGIALISRIEGPDPTALIGLPLIVCSRVLNAWGLSPLRSS